MTNQDERIDGLEQLFSQIARRFRKMHDDSLTFGQFFAMATLYHEGSMPMGTLAERLGVSMASATGMVDRLVHAGWVERGRSQTDRRVVWVELTPSGRESMTAKQVERHRQIQQLFAPLAEADLENLAQILKRVIDAMDTDDK